MQILLTNAKNALQTVKTTGTTFENARNAREIALAPAPIKKFCTRILNALEATDAAILTVDDAKFTFPKKFLMSKSIAQLYFRTFSCTYFTAESALLFGR